MTARFEARVTATYFTLDGEIKDKDYENWYMIGGSKFLPTDHKFETHDVVLAFKVFEGKKVWDTFDAAQAHINTGALAIPAQAEADRLGLGNIHVTKIAFITTEVRRLK